MTPREAFKLARYGLCPCGSARSLEQCCLRPGDVLRKHVPSLTPRPPATGHMEAGCYLSDDLDCSPDLSAEHPMSRAVLQEIGPTVRVGGVPWLPSGEQKNIGINNLKTRILCSRHNSALSPLDAEA